MDTDVSPYEVARDRQRFLVLDTAQQVTQPLTVIVTWPALFEQGCQLPITYSVPPAPADLHSEFFRRTAAVARRLSRRLPITA